MTQSPVVSFGLICFTTANKARLGQLTPWDVVYLQAAALRHLPADMVGRDFVLAFGDKSRTRDTVPAGDALLCAFEGWLKSQPVDAADYRDSEGLFDWQKRVDLQ